MTVVEDFGRVPVLAPVSACPACAVVPAAERIAALRAERDGRIMLSPLAMKKWSSKYSVSAFDSPSAGIRETSKCRSLPLPSVYFSNCTSRLGTRLIVQRNSGTS